MNSDTDFSWNNAKQTVEHYFYEKTGKYLTDIELLVLKGSWYGKTYEEIAAIANYTPDYLSKDIGNKLWRKMSDVLEETISKKNFRGAIERAWSHLNQQDPASELIFPHASIEESTFFPEGVMPLDSPFYLRRDAIETLCYESILKPGALLRIKAPKLMGKSSLMTRMLAVGQQEGQQTVYLDIGSVEQKIRQDLDKFLRWLCAMVTRQLGLENLIQEIWDTEILGSNDNCSVYFEEAILPNVSHPLILGLDNVDRIFDQSQVVEDFLGLLRSWFEKGKIYPQWSKVKFILAHSTDCYVPLDLNQSPFNAGIPVELTPFTQEQVQQLVALHNLSLSDRDLADLMTVLGGHPYLIQLALYYVKFHQLPLEEILRKAATEESIYGNHLRRCLLTIKDSAELADALKIVVCQDRPTPLDSMHIYKLHSMGLIQQQENQVLPTCRLYKDFFCRVL